MQAMIFAAGLGTRLKPLTNTMPKALVTVGGQTLLERTLTTLKNVNCSDIVINVHHFSNQIIEFLKKHSSFNQNIYISDETSQLLNTGGGLKKALPLFKSDEPILIHNVDIISNINLKEFYEVALQGKMQALLLVSERKTSRYLLFDDDMNLCGWINKDTNEVKTPYPSLNINKCKCFAFSGIHTFSPSLSSYFSAFPDAFGIIDFYLSICHKVQIRGYVKENLTIVDVGKFDTLSQVEEIIKTL